MKGRLEHSLQIEKNIKEILSILPQYVTEYYYEFKSGRQPTACREYIRKIAKFLYFIDLSNVKQINPKQITKFDVTRFLDSIEYIIDNNGNKKQSSLSYRKCYHSVLKSFFDFLTENDYITENPMNKIKRVRGEDFVNRKFLDEDDLKEVLLAVECGAGNRRSVAMQYKWKSRDRAIMMLFMQTGIRETALSEINIEDIDFENHVIKSVIEKGHKDKMFTMSSQLENAILEWICDREKIIDKNEEALFISKSKTRMTQKSLSNIVEKFTKEALGYSVTPHKLRASFANIMLEKTNENIYVVQQLLGHARTETTKIYLKNNLNQYNDMAADIIAKTIF
jgi:site-specific recombinase XerD